jgi:4-amino-4-deoxy-L-arabinose transferase-like glycosyltransferase
MDPAWARSAKEAFRRSVDRYRNARWSERLFALAMGFVVLVGILYRCNGVIVGRPLVLWLDECSWANLLLEQPLRDLLIRPIGFMAVSKVLALTFGPSEIVLRLMSVLAGVGTMLLAPALAGRLFKTRWAQLVFVLILALQPDAIDHAREFKPYAVGLFLHALLLLLALRYVHTKHEGVLRWGVVFAVLSVLFAQDVIFAYPGFFLAVGVVALRSGSRRHIALVVAGAAAALALVGAQYLLIWSKIPSSESDYWGRKYDVFYVAKTAQSHAAWFASKYQAMAAFPGSRRIWWESTQIATSHLREIAKSDALLWFGLHVAGIAIIAWRRFYLGALLIVGPFVTVSVMNTLGHWPMGAFRTNTFMLVYGAALASFAGDWQASGLLRRLASVPAMLMSFAILVPFFMFGGEPWHRKWFSPAYALAMPEIARRMVTIGAEHPANGPEPLILHRLHCEPWTYYTKHNPAVSRAFGRELERRFVPLCAETQPIEELLAAYHRGDRVWVMNIHPDTNLIKRILRPAYVADMTVNIEGSHVTLATHK